MHDDDNNGNGCFSLQKYSVLPELAEDIFKYDETLDKVIFYKEVSFNGGGGSGVTQEYVDIGDATTLNLAESYADTKAADTLNSAKSYADTGDLTTLNSALNYADTGDTSTLNLANTYTDSTAATTLASSKTYTDNKTWTASQISDFNAAVRANRLDQLAKPTASLDINNQKLMNVLTPTLATDGTNKTYVDTGDTSTLNSSKAYTDAKIWSASSFSGYPDDASKYLNGKGIWSTIAQQSWTNIENLPFNQMEINWQNPSFADVGQTHNVPELSSGSTNFFQLIQTKDASNVNYGWRWDYRLGSAIGHQNQMYLDLRCLMNGTLSNSLLQISSNNYPDYEMYLGMRLLLGNKRISQVGDPVETTDAANMQYVASQRQAIEQKPLNLFAVPNGNLSLNGYNIINLANGVSTNDAINLGQLNAKTWLASQITNFDTQVRTSRLDQMAPPTNILNLNSKIIQNLASGISSTDAANVSQVTAVQTNLNNKTLWFNQPVSDYTTFSTAIGITNTVTRDFVAAYFRYNSAQNKADSNVYNPSILANYSLDCEGRIRASEFNAFSSIKKKNILEDNNVKVEQEAISLLKQIPVVKYEYKDKIKEGNGISYGVIAEQLNEVLPDYVDMQSYDFVPNVMCEAKAIRLKKDYYELVFNNQIENIEKDAKLRLVFLETNISEDAGKDPSKSISVNVTQAKDNSIFFESEENIPEEIFVYGTYETCPTVAKQPMFELTMAVVQNLLKRVEQLEMDKL